MRQKRVKRAGFVVSDLLARIGITTENRSAIQKVREYIADAWRRPPVFVVQNALKPLMDNDYWVGAVFLRSAVFANKKPPEGGCVLKL